MQPLTLLVTYKTKPGMMMPFVESIIDAGLLDIIRAEDGCLRYDYYFPAVPPTRCYSLKCGKAPNTKPHTWHNPIWHSSPP